MSGQRAKPKYNRVHFPSKDLFVTKFPSKSTADQGPPIAGLPAAIYWKNNIYHVPIQKNESIREKIHIKSTLGLESWSSQIIKVLNRFKYSEYINEEIHDNISQEERKDNPWMYRKDGIWIEEPS